MIMSSNFLLYGMGLYNYASGERWIQKRIFIKKRIFI